MEVAILDIEMHGVPVAGEHAQAHNQQVRYG